VSVLGAGGFDWSSAGIAVAALVGLLVVSIAVLSALREGRERRLNRRK
jgi:heme exporter protein D